MYIYDCIYGKIEFEKKIYQCMLTPEMQRLREVRLGNINSLFLTGCANVNRFEHSVGTAYLAKINCENNLSSVNRKEKQNFILAALLHDVGNGPFGHSYEYISEKQGFIPENSVGDVIDGVKVGSHKKIASLAPFFEGVPNGIERKLDGKDIKYISEIVGGKNEKYSKLISDTIDLDNIDNVFRMAYHMGLGFDKNAPICLAKGIICENNRILFKEQVVPYLYEWYSTRTRMYKLLLYNPQDFAAKCMLNDALDAVLENSPEYIKWNSTDSELIKNIKGIGEIWLSYDLEIKPIDNTEYFLEDVFGEVSSSEIIKDSLERCYGIHVPEKATVKCIREYDGSVGIEFYNTKYCYKNKRLYKSTRVPIDVNQIITRLMVGDLYRCVAIYKTLSIECYDFFSELKKRKRLEQECNIYIESGLNEKGYQFSFHAIVDKCKTNRQLNICLSSGEEFCIGTSTNEMLVGVFLKSQKYGMANGRDLSDSKREILSKKIRSFLSEYMNADFIECVLYNEVDEIG